MVGQALDRRQLGRDRYGDVQHAFLAVVCETVAEIVASGPVSYEQAPFFFDGVGQNLGVDPVEGNRTAVRCKVGPGRLPCADTVVAPFPGRPGVRVCAVQSGAGWPVRVASARARRARLGVRVGNMPAISTCLLLEAVG